MQKGESRVGIKVELLSCTKMSSHFHFPKSTVQQKSMVFILKLFICIFILLSSVSSLIPPAFLSRDAFLSHATAFATSLISINLINVVESVADSSGKRYITTPEGIEYMVTKDPKDSSSPKPVRAQKVKASYTLYLNGFPEDTPSSKKLTQAKEYSETVLLNSWWAFLRSSKVGMYLFSI